MHESIIAELDSKEATVALVWALRDLRDRGRVDMAAVRAYTPFPIPELDDALAIRRTRIPYLTLAAGLTGCALAVLIQWWTNAVDYPIDVGGRPLASIPAYVPIAFETTILLAGLTTFASVLLAGRMPRLHDPMFDIPGFERTRIDRFWVALGDLGTPDAPAVLSRGDVAVLRDVLATHGARVVHGRLSAYAP